MRTDREHGSPYDRGQSDAYYQRPAKPHYFIGETWFSARIEETGMTAEEVAEYHLGYANNDCGEKDYGT